MELHSRIGLAFICVFFSFHFIYSEKPLNESGTINWTCICASPPATPDPSPASNCSASCGCKPVGGGAWNCACAFTESSQAPKYIDTNSCLSPCNCTFGSPGTVVSPKNHVYSKIVLILVVIFGVLTIIVLLASAAYYFYRKDRLATRPPVYTTDKDTSWNSTTDLISHPSFSFPHVQTNINSSWNLFSGVMKRNSMSQSKLGITLPAAIVDQFSYTELEQATEKFSNANLIGIGGSSKVYRGQLRDGTTVAIKQLRPHGGLEIDTEFLCEVELMSRLNHCNVVHLLGYCIEGQGNYLHRLLVFEYMINGNLRDCLDAKHGKAPMDWETRVQIAVGAAKGLGYLHEASAPRVLHRDVKSSNILLDDKFNAKITDLGMAKRQPSGELSSCPSSPARMLGTFGYFAPEYAIVGKASMKSDVFSFGVVVLELITGRQAIRRTNKGDESLVLWATTRLSDSKLVISEFPDPLLKGKFPEDEMHIMARLARECLQWDPELRPTMSEVLQILLTIAPEKSKRRTVPAISFMNPCVHNSKNASGTLTPEVSNEGLSSQASSERWFPSWQSTTEKNSLNESPRTPEKSPSANRIAKMNLVDSKAQSFRLHDDEIVDLSEPRYELFLQPSILSW